MKPLKSAHPDFSLTKTWVSGEEHGFPRSSVLVPFPLSREDSENIVPFPRSTSLLNIPVVGGCCLLTSLMRMGGYTPHTRGYSSVHQVAARLTFQHVLGRSVTSGLHWPQVCEEEGFYVMVNRMLIGEDTMM